MRIAFFSPLPPASTGVADYSATLLSELARRADITVFSDDHQLPSPNLQIHPVSAFALRANEFDARVYQLGNSWHYASIYEMLLKLPGAVVLHDGTLHHFFMERLLRERDRLRYLREMTYAHAARGYEMAQAVLRGAFVYPYYEFPLLARALDHATTVIAHSETIRRAALESRPQTRVSRIDHFAFPPPPARGPRAALRARLGLPHDAFVVSAFGPMASAKRASVALRAFAEFARTYTSASPYFVWVGATRVNENSKLEIREAGIENNVRFIGYVNEATLYDFMRASDAAVNLRFPTAGEASGVVMRLLAVGVPTIVTRAGWYAELPAEVVLHTPIGEDEIPSLVQHLVRLAKDSTFHQQLSDSARAFAESRSVARAADEYIAALSEM